MKGNKMMTDSVPLKLPECLFCTSCSKNRCAQRIYFTIEMISFVDKEHCRVLH